MISIVIPTYKNKEQLLRNLLHNMQYFSECEVIIINDNPEENLEDDLKKIEGVMLLNNEKNLGFGSSANRGIQAAKNRYIVLLNTDVLLHDNHFRQLTKRFKDDEMLFAVSFVQTEKNGKKVGKNIISWKQGMIHHDKAADLKYGNTAWAEGGTCMIDKEKFTLLGEFDSLYYPFYWEDTDLSYRAWKNDYKVIFDPSVLVDHYHESTISKYFSRQYVQTLSYRNQFIFTWKNITDRKLLLSHAAFLLPNIFYFIFKKEFGFVKGFFLALLKLPSIIKQRTIDKKMHLVKDEVILNKFI